MSATGGSVITAFNDFIAATGSAYTSGPGRIVNLAAKRNYFWNIMLMGSESNPTMIQSGQNIREKVIAKPMNKAQFHNFGATYQFSGQDALLYSEAYWRQATTDVQWNEAEIMLNVQSRGDGAAAVFVDMKHKLEMQALTDLWNGKETALWKAPNTNMEGAGTGDSPEPYSIPTLVNAFTNGLPPSFTTRLGIDPVAQATLVDGKMGAVTGEYSSRLPDNVGNVVNQLAQLVRRVRFLPPPSFKEYWETPEYRKQVIATSLNGVTEYTNLLRYGQDRFVAGPQDPDYPGPMCAGVQVKDVAELDDESLAIYANTAGTGLSSEDGTGTGADGPRYFVLNFNYMFPVMHGERWFYKREVQRAAGTLDTWQLPISSWYNIFSTDMGARQGILSPAGALDFSDIY